jgi:hypothetical protein
MVNVYTYLENLFKESYTLPIIIATVSIAVLIPIFQEYKETKQKEALEEKENKDEPDSSAHPSGDDKSSESAAPKPKAFALPTTYVHCVYFYYTPIPSILLGMKKGGGRGSS